MCRILSTLTLTLFGATDCFYCTFINTVHEVNYIGRGCFFSRQTIFTEIHLPRFSPPHTSICMSYLPSSSNQDLSMTKRPPAIMGVLKFVKLKSSYSVVFKFHFSEHINLFIPAISRSITSYGMAKMGFCNEPLSTPKLQFAEQKLADVNILLIKL